MGSRLLGEHASGVGAVLLHGSANLVELGRVVVGHSLEATVVGSLVGVDQALQLSILLQVLPVTLVTDHDHAVHLGTHIGVDLGLSELVLVDDTGQLCDASVGLSNLLLHGGTERADLGAEHPLGCSDTGSSLTAGLCNPLHVLGETLVVQSLGSVEGCGHVSGGSLEREIGVLAVTGHASTDTTEAGSCLGDHNLEPVVGPLASGLSLAALLGNDLVPEVPGSLSPVQGNLPADGCRCTNVRPVANVRKVRSRGKPPLSPTHRAVEIVPGFAGIVCHPAKESSLELLASSHVESEVAIHLGAHVGNVT